MVSVEAPVPLKVAGANPAVAPEGSPATLSAILPVNEDPAVTLTVKFVLLPVTGAAEIWKSCALSLALTLSNVDVPNVADESDEATNPMYTFAAILSVTVLPTCVHATPSAEMYPLNALPCRTTLTQYGTLIPPALGLLMGAPAVARVSKNQTLLW
jgi:hypothetical protein